MFVSWWRWGSGVPYTRYCMANSTGISDLEPYPHDLFEAVVSAYPQWLSMRILAVTKGVFLQSEVDEIVNTSFEAMSKELLAMLATDVDQQRSNPLHVLRMSTVAANEFLRSANVPPAVRDEFEVKAMPHDVYSIGPLTWKDLSEEVHDAGISWGAWKAAMVLTRRRSEGKIS